MAGRKERSPNSHWMTSGSRRRWRWGFATAAIAAITAAEGVVIIVVVAAAVWGLSSLGGVTLWLILFEHQKVVG
jgi:hypothetical protein